MNETKEVLSKNAVSSLLERGFSRRHLGRIATLLTAGASLPFYNEFAIAQDEETPTRGGPARGSRGAGIPYDPSMVRISSNENPMGPHPAGLEALTKVAPLGWRYNPGPEMGNLAQTISKIEGVRVDHIWATPGSSEPLHAATCAFTSPTRSWTMASPGYGSRAPAFIGSNVIGVPLAADYSHDVEAMLKSQPNAGAYYICNPNNPTATITPREKIDWLLANKPKDAVVVVDEAYIHFSANAKMCSDLVAAGKDVVVLRTFSKIYGMAGLRAGFAMGRPDLLAKMRVYGSSGMTIVTGVACANASLLVTDLVPTRRKQMMDIREDTFSFLDKKGVKYLPSEGNFFMMSVKGMTGAQVGQAMSSHKVQLAGNRWPEWPQYIRVTVGTSEEMGKFKEALTKVVG